MITWLVSSIICFLLFWKFTRYVEVEEQDKWVAFRMPLWMWIVAGILSIIPVLNFGALIGIIIAMIVEANDDYPMVRFAKSKFITKIIELLNKKY
jgi:hypothetical protein